MVSGGITKGDMSKSKDDPCWVCSLRVMAESGLCLQCCKWIHRRCAGVKWVAPILSKNFACRKCEGNIGEAMKQEEKSCDISEAAWEFTYHGDRATANGGCEAAVTARTGWRCDKLRESGELLHGRRHLSRLKWTVHSSYIRPAILCGSEAWCLKESEMGILLKTELSMVRSMCGV